MARALNIAVLVSGRGTNLKALIDAIQDKKLLSTIRLVISNNDKAPALIRAQEASIPTCVISSKTKDTSLFEQELLRTLQDLKPDLIVLAGFMRILSKRVISAFKDKIINIHPALLPSFKGLHAQRQAIEAGVKITGCTVHFVTEECDAGPIIVQKSIDVLPDDTEETLSQRLLEREHEALVTAIQLIERDKVVLQGCRTLIKND